MQADGSIPPPEQKAAGSNPAGGTAGGAQIFMQLRGHFGLRRRGLPIRCQCSSRRSDLAETLRRPPGTPSTATYGPCRSPPRACQRLTVTGI